MEKIPNFPKFSQKFPTQEYKIFTQIMSKYTITQQSLSRHLHSNKHKKQHSQSSAKYASRVREILLTSKKNSKSQSLNQNLIGKLFQGKKFIVHRFQTEQSDNQEEQIVYQLKDDKLPKIKKKYRTTRNPNIDETDKLIIQNYMNAKLIELKNINKKKQDNKIIDHSHDMLNHSGRIYNLYKKFATIQSVSTSQLKKEKNNVNQEKHHRSNKLQKLRSNRDSIQSSQKNQSQITNTQKQQIIIKNNTQQLSTKKTSKSNASHHNQFPRQQTPNPTKQLIKQFLQQQKTTNPPDPLNIQTQFSTTKKLQNPQKPFTTVSTNITQIKIPQIPQLQWMENFIQNYIPEYQDINMELLMANQSFEIVENVVSGKKKIYFGETKNCKKHGKGVEIMENSLFQGIWNEDDKVMGIQKIQRGKYKGEFKDGKRCGKGQFYWNNGQYYEGQWQNGRKHGNGYWRTKHGESYSGEWNNGLVSGHGIYIGKNGQRYDGDFVKFQKQGFGREIFPNGDVYEGRYANGFPHGKGKYLWRDGTMYEGEFIEGFREGKGVLIVPNQLHFEGSFKKETIFGIGKLKMANGDIFTGMFQNNKKNGYGVFDLKAENTNLKGFWSNNSLLSRQI